MCRWPLDTVGVEPGTGFSSAHLGSSVVPLNWSESGEQPVEHSTGVVAEEPDMTRKKSNEAVPPPWLPRNATGPIFNGPVNGAEWVSLPILIQLVPLSTENSPTMFVPFERARTRTEDGNAPLGAGVIEEAIGGFTDPLWVTMCSNW